MERLGDILPLLVGDAVLPNGSSLPTSALRMRSLMPTASLVTTRDSLAARLAQWRLSIAALDEPSCVLSPASRALAKANQTAALHQHEARLTTLDAELVLARERDALQATRPPGCTCLGLLQRADGTWCACPEGAAARDAEARADEAAQAARAIADQAAVAAAAAMETRERQDRAHLPPHYREATFDTFPFAESKAAVVEHLQALATAAVPRRGVYLWGSFGVGKTGLACAALNTRILARRAALFVTVSDFLDWVRRTYDRQAADTTDEVMQRVMTAPFLVLDDLGAEYLTRWGRDRLFALLNHRDTHDLCTLITSNYRPSEIALRLAGDDDPREGQRLVWRILEACDVIELRGDNLRQSTA
jgi:DNA replication protein DnaC